MIEKRVADLEAFANKQLELMSKQAEATDLFVAQIQALTVIAMKSVSKLPVHERKIIRAEAIDCLSGLAFSDLSIKAAEAIMNSTNDGAVPFDLPKSYFSH